MEYVDGGRLAYRDGEGGGFTVSAADNPDTSERTADITVTPSERSASPKAVRVVQEGKVLPPSLTLSYDGGTLPEEGFTLSYNDNNPMYIDIEAVNVEWNISVEYEGDSAGWLNAVKRMNGQSFRCLTGMKTPRPRRAAAPCALRPMPRESARLRYR